MTNVSFPEIQYSKYKESWGGGGVIKLVNITNKRFHYTKYG